MLSELKLRLCSILKINYVIIRHDDLLNTIAGLKVRTARTYPRIGYILSANAGVYTNARSRRRELC